MPSIDERVVSMAFENAVFEQRVAQTMASLGKLNDAIAKTGQTSGLSNIEKDANKVTLNAPMSALDKLRQKLGRGVDATAIQDIEKSGNKVTLEQPGKAVDKLQGKMDQLSAGSTFSDIEKASNQVELSGLTRALEGAANRFSVLEGAAAVALGNIVSKAAYAGANFSKSFAFGPIKQGFQEYQTNLSSIQTILANTSDSGGNLKTVNAALDELNQYSDKTIYNFSEMAKNIGTFTAAGVRLKPATESIKGIANLAALSGSNSQQASTAMYQLSQAIAAGKVGLQDWNSVVNAGMGGAVFQKSLMRTAENMGTIEKGAIKIDKATGKATINGQSFRESIMAKPGQQSWLSSDVLTKTLGQLTGDMTDAQLAAEGFSAAQIKLIQKQAKLAGDAATQVKTLPQVFDVARETIGSGWSATFRTIFGDFEESKKTFTSLSQTINGFINTNADARNKVLDAWKELGGRTELIKGIKAAFEAVMSVLKPIKEAFRDIFPAKTGKQLFEMTQQFTKFMQGLKLGSDTAENLKRTFRGVFAVLHIGFSIVKGLAGVFFDLLGVVGKGSGGILNFTGSIGDFLTSLDQALTKGGALTGFFNGLSAVLQVPLNLITGIASGIASLFGGFNGGSAAEINAQLKKTGEVMTPLQNVVSNVKNAWAEFVDVLGKFKEMVDPFFDKVRASFATIGDAIADGIKDADFDKVLLAFQTTFLGGIFLTLKKLISGGGKGPLGAFSGFMGELKGTLGAVTGQLTAMQKNVQASTLLKIGAAIGILALAIKLLSTIDPGKMTTAMTAIAVGLGELSAALYVMTAKLGKAQIALLPLLAAGLVGVAGAMVLLAVAVKIFATMSWDELGRGLAGVAGSMTAIGLAMKTIGATRLAPIGAGLILVGLALNIIAVAVKMFSSMKWEELAKGLLGLGVSLAVMAGGLALMGPELLLVGPGLLAAAFGMTMLAGAVGAFGALDPKKMLTGVLGLGLAVSALGLSLMLITPAMILQAGGLIVASVGLTALAGALTIFGKMGVGGIAKALVAMGGSLVILAVGLALMVGSLPGAVSLLAAAAAFAVLGPALAFMGNLKWGTILKGLAAMALTLGVIAVLGLVAAPALVALGGALALLGVGLILIGSAVYIAAKGLSLLGDSGAKGLGTLIAAITAFVALVPSIVINFTKGLLAIAEELAKVAPKVLLAIGVMIDAIIAFVIEQAPKLGLAINTLIATILNILATNAGPLITAGWRLIQALLTGVSNNISSVVTKVGEIISKFLNAFATQAPRLVQSGAKVLGSFLGGIATALPTVLNSAAKVVGKFLEGITSKLPGVITKGAKLIVTFLTEITKHVPDFVKAGARLIVAVIDGVGSKLASVINAGVRLIRNFIFGIAEAVPRLADAGAKAVIRFINGLAAAIRDNDDALVKAGFNLADAILDGMVAGFRELGHRAIDAVKGVIGSLPKAARKLLGIHSPSKVFAEIGGHTVQGLADGMAGNHKAVLDTSENMANGLIGMFKDTLGVHSPSQVLKDIGKEVGRGFKQGLEGSETDIRNAFQSMKDKIRDELKNQRDAFKQEKDNLAGLQKQYVDKLTEINQLRSEKKPDKEAINSAVEEADAIRKAINSSIDTIQQYKGNISSLKGANADLTRGLQDEKRLLIGLAKDYEDISSKLEDAKKALDDATRTRDDAVKSYSDQYSQLPDQDNLLSEALADAELTWQERAEKERKKREEAEKKSRIDQVALYKKALAEQIQATKKYQETLQKLRELGLDDVTYKKLLSQGLAGQSFAEQLLAGGKSGVDQLNAMDAELIAQSTDLAKQAAYNLYQAGVDAAQGLVDGLAAKKGDLEKAMENLAATIVRKIKSDLGIRSPSRIFAEVGKFAAQGLAQGLTASAPMVANAAAGVGADAASALKDSLANISDTVASEIDTDLKITPILDLSQVQKDAGQLQDLTNVVPITAAKSYGQASAISSDSARFAEESADAQAAAPSFHYEQHITSPEALSETEIYRQTNNQLSKVKDMLGLNTRISGVTK